MLTQVQKKPRKAPLLLAVKGATPQHVKCVGALLECGADPNVRSSNRGKTPLHIAIEHQPFKHYGKLIYLLLQFGANPNIKDKNGDSPILQILYGGYEPLEKHRRDALALILNETHFWTDVNIRPPGTLNMPLHLAVRRKDPWAVGMLLEKKALVNEPNGAGLSPFAMAVASWSTEISEDQKEITRLLLKHDAAVDELIGASRSTALHTAISLALVDMVEMLLFYSAKPEVKNASGQDAYAICAASLEEGKIDKETQTKMLDLLKSNWEREPSEASSDESVSDTGATQGIF